MKGETVLAKCVLIIGDSGAGKSASLRNFEPSEISIFNVTNKSLPFKKKLPMRQNCTYADIAEGLSNPTKKAYLIDDATYLMVFESFDRAQETGFQKFTEMAKKFKDMLTFITTQVPDDVIVYITMHTEGDEETHVLKPKTIGKMIDSQLKLEGLVETVLRAVKTDEGYKFITRDDPNSVAKSSMGMFENNIIDNDLRKVDEIIREYYDMPPLVQVNKSKAKKE